MKTKSDQQTLGQMIQPQRTQRTRLKRLPAQCSLCPLWILSQSYLFRFRRNRLIFSIVAAFCLWATPATVAQSDKAAPTKPPRDYPVKPVPFTAVHFNDVFWAPRIEINRTVTIPFAFEKCEETKRVYHFERAAAALRG